MAVTAGVMALSTPALAAVNGFDVKITELPRTFAAGAGPATVTVVASTNSGAPCQKVRWSMLMQVDGVQLDQVKVKRVEDDNSFPLQVQANGDTARLTDAELDPGTLCNGQTVTARYEVSFDDEADSGTVRFQAEAYDVRERLLQRADGTSTVVNGDDTQGDDSADKPTPSATPSDDSGDTSGTDDPVAAGTQNRDDIPDPSKTPAIAAVPASNGRTPSLLGAGLIIGALLMFMGVGLLLRLRLRARYPDRAAPLQ